MLRRWRTLDRRKSEDAASAACVSEVGKAKERVQFVNSVNKKDGWTILGVGDIIVDTAADESCWLFGVGRCFSDEGKPEEDVVEDCEWRIHAAVRQERGDFLSTTGVRARTRLDASSRSLTSASL